MEPYTLRYVLNHLKTQEMSEKAVPIIFPDGLKTECMCNKAVRRSLKTQGMCACNLEFFSDSFKTEDSICNEAVCIKPWIRTAVLLKKKCF